MTTVEYAQEMFTETQPKVDTERAIFKTFVSRVMDAVRGTKYEEAAQSSHSSFANQQCMVPTFKVTHLPTGVKNYVVDYPFGD